MSVGGRVVEVAHVNASKVWVNTDDNPNRTRGKLPNLCAVFVDPEGHDIQPGDSLWWQSGTCYWTPQARPFGVSDIPLRKIGYSGVNKPAPAEKGPRT